MPFPHRTRNRKHHASHTLSTPSAILTQALTQKRHRPLRCLFPTAPQSARVEGYPVMAELRIDPAELKSLVRDIVTSVLQELEQHRLLVNGKLALSEPEAAELLGLHPWQLRDVRLAGKIGHTRITGNKVRYSLEDLQSYLAQGHEPGNGRK